MANTSARKLLERIQRAESWDPQLIAAAAEDPNLFRDLVEPLSDAFDPHMTAAYVSIFSEIIERKKPALRASENVRRFERIRQPRRFAGPDPEQVIVLSRVTLGADVAITSVVLSAVLKRFPHARITFAGPRKCWELFATEPRIELLDIPYQRATALEQKLDISLNAQNAIVIDPDSRITQLGLLPVCEEDRYYFFDSRSDPRPSSLSHLASLWVESTFGVSGAPWVGTEGPSAGAAEITVSLGVGGNESKRIGGNFERELMQLLATRNLPILVDKGAGGEEAERVDRAIKHLPNVTTFQGDFAHFARAIARSRLYVGYDSAGQHVAAAAGVPHAISIFNGYPNDRFVQRWSPPNATIVRAKHREAATVLAELQTHLLLTPNS